MDCMNGKDRKLLASGIASAVVGVGWLLSRVYSNDTILTVCCWLYLGFLLILLFVIPD